MMRDVYDVRKSATIAVTVDKDKYASSYKWSTDIGAYKVFTDPRGVMIIIPQLDKHIFISSNIDADSRTALITDILRAADSSIDWSDIIDKESNE
jgi:hypothetical protein